MIIGQVYRKLMEIESRLLPCGLHVVGVMPTAEEAIATLVNIAEIDRPDQVGLQVCTCPAQQQAPGCQVPEFVVC